MKRNDALAAMAALGVFVLPFAAQAGTAPASISKVPNLNGVSPCRLLIVKTKNFESGAILASAGDVGVGVDIHAVVCNDCRSNGS
jgi:hypothetical protein